MRNTPETTAESPALSPRALMRTLHSCIDGVAAYQKTQLQLGSIAVGSKFDGDHGASDVVTEVDRESERMIRSVVQREFPGYAVYGEEQGADVGDASRLVVCDPLDGTLSYTKGLPGFGPILAAYHDGRCVAGVERNTLRGTTASASLDDDFTLEGPLPDGLDDTFRCSGVLPGKVKTADLFGAGISAALGGAQQHGGGTQQDVLYRSYVFGGHMRAFFHSGLAWHDIAAAPIFGEKTGVLVTNHRGVPYERFDVELERERYRIGTKAAVYCYPIVIARAEDHGRVIDALAPHRDVLDHIARGER